MCSVVSVETENIQLEMNEWSVIIMADGCCTNVFPGNKISECFGLVSHSIRCDVYVADRLLERLTNSKRIKVSIISQFISHFCTILFHFQQSGKSSCSWSEELGILDMKSIHTKSFCPTRIAYLLSTYTQLVDLLLPVSDVLASATLRKEKSGIFLSPKLMIKMHLLADLEPFFQWEFLKLSTTTMIQLIK